MIDERLIQQTIIRPSFFLIRCVDHNLFLAFNRGLPTFIPWNLHEPDEAYRMDTRTDALLEMKKLRDEWEKHGRFEIVEIFEF